MNETKEQMETVGNDSPTSSSVTTTPIAPTLDPVVEPTTSQRHVKFSEPSETLLAESRRLLEMRPSQTIAIANGEIRSTSPITPSGGGARARSPSRFPRIDFDNLIDEQIADRKPAWKQLQESVTDSYYKAKRTVERKKEETEFLDSQLQRRGRNRRSISPFAHLDTTPDRSSSRYSSYSAYGNTEDGPYAAPAVNRSQGIESNYERRANEIEARLLRTTILPERMKTVTMRDFRRAPSAAPGSFSEAAEDDVDYQSFMPRPYYSRPNRDDPDYFDFDLQHSVDMFKRPEGRYVPRGPQEWEAKLLSEARGKGEAPISGYMFTKGDSDWRRNGTSYLSAALRTPSFWEQRFTSIGQQVRERNPISLDSINRNRPVPSRFTEYRDPDFEDYEDPRDD